MLELSVFNEENIKFSDRKPWSDIAVEKLKGTEDAVPSLLYFRRALY